MKSWRLKDINGIKNGNYAPNTATDIKVWKQWILRKIARNDNEDTPPQQEKVAITTMPTKIDMRNGHSYNDSY